MIIQQIWVWWLKARSQFDLLSSSRHWSLLLSRIFHLACICKLAKLIILYWKLFWSEETGLMNGEHGTFIWESHTYLYTFHVFACAFASSCAWIIDNYCDGNRIRILTRMFRLLWLAGSLELTRDSEIWKL